MSILVDSNTRLIVQGITGREGNFHTKQMIDYGTNVVGGTTPGKGGEWVFGTVPVFDTMQEAVQATGANTSIIYVRRVLRPMPSMRQPTRGSTWSCALLRAFRCWIWCRCAHTWTRPTRA